jgi:hypothetical protein
VGCFRLGVKFRDAKLRYLPALLFFAIAVAPLSADPNSKPDQFTPLVVSPLNSNVRPFLGTDRRLHIVYELVLTDASPTPATLEKIEVTGASSSSPVLASYSGKDLLSSLKTRARLPAENATIEFNGTRLFLIDLSLGQLSGRRSAEG